MSVIDRYLEHARIFYFYNNGKPEYLLLSADWMQPNFDHRVEIAFPVLDEQHQAKLKEILETQLADTAKCWRIRTMAIPCAFAPVNAVSALARAAL